MKVLVAYASGHGSTAEVAQRIGGELKTRGLNTVISPVQDVGSVDGFDAFVLGSAVHAGTWLPEMISFLKNDNDFFGVKGIYSIIIIIMYNGRLESFSKINVSIPIRSSIFSYFVLKIKNKLNILTCVYNMQLPHHLLLHRSSQIQTSQTEQHYPALFRSRAHQSLNIPHQVTAPSP